MALPPLTHHEILRWVEPFARRGRAVDLPASDRFERRLAFRPIDLPATDRQPALRETLRLESLRVDRFRLTRVLAREAGPEAQLQVDGADPADLLAWIEAVPPHRQWRLGPDELIAFSHRLVPGVDAEPALVLTAASAQVAGLRLSLTLPSVEGIPAELKLAALTAGERFDLPEDLLAVLGWHWARLERAREGWGAQLRLARREPGRSGHAERRIEEAVRHLAATLAEPPARFHERWRAARWRVALRRAVPMLTCVGLIGAAAASPRLGLAQDSPVRMLIFNAPPLLLVAFFCLREMPRIEIPPLPRASQASSWRLPPPAAAGGEPVASSTT